MENKRYDIIIVGAGPAGMTAALYAKRSNKTVLILEKETIGGQISLAPKVENFPTIKSITGAELSDMMFEQVMAMGVEFELENVHQVEKVDHEFIVTTDYNTYKARSVIIATGAKHKMIGLKNEEDFIGKGLSYCATCDGAFFKKEEVAVIGDGNSALQYALQLSDICQKVYVCTLFDKFFGDSVLIERLHQKPNISVIPNISLVELKGSKNLEELVFENLLDKSLFRLPVKGCFIAIGQCPDNDIIKNLVEINKAGYVVADETTMTKTLGLFVAGDCRTKQVRQATTAVSDGAIAAMQAVEYLNQ